jgi:uncharacterized protein (DUF1015 family)
MVRVYPFNAFASAEVGNKQVVHSAPNRFCKNQNQSYDRSVVDPDTDEIHENMNGFVSDQREMQIPIVILSKRRGREKEKEQEWGSSANLCSEYGISYRNVKEFIDGGIIELVKEQSFLIYSQHTAGGGGHRQVGICAALAVEDCFKGNIKRHEKVIKESMHGPSAHRRPSHTSSNPPHPRNVDPVMMMYRQDDTIQNIINKIIARENPVCMQARSRHNSRLGLNLDDDEGGNNVVVSDDEHKIWSITNEADIEAVKNAFLKVESLYIADGHHRTAAACRMALINKGQIGEGQKVHSHTK